MPAIMNTVSGTESPATSSDISRSTPVPNDNQFILDAVNSPTFSLYDCIRMIHKHSDNIGIHHFLCEKLLTFPHNELQFYIPQLVQILITVETASMALEDLLTKLRNENPHFALLTFWQLQALLADLSTDPESYGFQVARRVLNDQQYALFNTSIDGKDDDDDDFDRKVDPNTGVISRKSKMQENIAPAIMYSSLIFATIASPALAEYAEPLVESQGRRQKAFVFKLAKSAMKDFRKNITLKNTLMNKKKHKHSKDVVVELNRDVGYNSYQRNATPPTSPKVDLIPPKTFEDQMFKKQRDLELNLNFDMVDNIGQRVFEEKISNKIKLPKRRSKYLDSSYVHRTYSEIEMAKSDENIDAIVNQNKDIPNPIVNDKCSTEMKISESISSQFTSSMPDLHDIQKNDQSKEKNELKCRASTSHDDKGLLLRTASSSNLSSLQKAKLKGKNKEVDIEKLSTTKKIKLLKTNYFKYETQFAIALETISQRLSSVPADARLSALRAELSLLNRDLPAEVDIPTLLPASKKGKLHKLCTITANEAQVLNSAEKVPYLLLIEYLRNEFDFDPTTEDNEEILRKKTNISNLSFDLNIIGNGDLNNDAIILNPTKSDSVMNLSNNANKEERVASQMSDLSLTPSNYSEFGPKEIDLSDLSMIGVRNQTDAEAYRESLVMRSTTKVPVIEEQVEGRNPELNFAMNLDAVVKNGKGELSDRYDETNELADQMRISALMLSQLDKSPQELSDVANQIRAKIIASMKEGQDKFGFNDLDQIHGMAGERKLENDLMTGGIDTSYLGEDWAAKKERIRKTSEYGHLENWDLCSVIAKSGDDLRQEAFACQVIQAMAQIWTKEKVPVWVKKMKILITSANTGLVETITNAVSVHSIKKSLTKKMIEENTLDEKGGIASLNDHYLRAFGEPKGFKYRRAQDNFASSLAAYSVICYLLQIKDRHNGNIMIDNEGHVCHIDFGFMLSNSPGSVGFESAPFKLTYEYAEVLGGIDGEPYKKFVNLTKAAFKSVRKYSDQIISMCEIMQKDNMQPCFNAGEQTSVQLKQRFHLELAEDEVDDFVENFLVAKSLGSIYTRLYDQFQLITQGIYS
ncbi:hypothetical protein TPHA_0B04460 [Tetrapisispora phaffii CBS 4417]|uniref:1-phosphatidylinositol 4-kinase n=1 Tax=Tetrapisispora phaffii (strain ATCC 24235 / CBS 4417 / NBRC 1672 / NRRL Y-8282 / UCD 70-5) TaxID=1071381 RepID=G8BQ34_TETPH|nr:hypothetical protein TPHA_0B04460 [Tetrapisispora phaffii CBS 4417]CCE62115.1 hypothetical protein TPHA_0B04460 [Tetrapisispora phaffii CBS 4417]